MNERSKRNAALASIGLLALGIYILACTSFSPDDRKVLYPAFDAASGAVGMAMYDRETRSSEMWFLPVEYQGGITNAVASPINMRAQWLINGRDIVVAYASPEAISKEGITVTLVPWGARGPIKTFQIPDIDEPATSFIMPLCLANECLFLSASKSGREVIRLDLRTGALTHKHFAEAEGDIYLYPAPDGEGVFYVEEEEGPDRKMVFGRLNPSNFSRKPLMQLPKDLPDEGVIAYDRTGQTLAFLAGGDETNTVLVLRDGQRVFTRSLDTHGRRRRFINAVLAVNGKAIRATFQQADGTNAVAYGLMEVPFSEAPAREITLIKNAPKADESTSFYFQMAVSHDGKTAALASTYLACSDEEFNPTDCALFLVDLSEPNWKLTKVPIPMPAKRPDLMR